MAKPFLRYLPAKLKPLSAPAVWIPLTIFTLLSVLLWEYYQNPDWFERDPITNANPESNLTPEEQAKLSEIDTVDLLLKGAQVSGPLLDQKIRQNPNQKASDKALAPDTLNSVDGVDSEAQTANGDRQLANRSNPFGAYAADYKFSGANQSRTTSRSPNSSPASNNAPSTSSFNFGTTESSPPAIAPNALSEAIDRQEAIKASKAQRNGASPSPSDLSQPASTTPAPGNISVPFIRTTPAMSPPTGTTGYNPPATADLPSFNLAPTQPTRSAPIAPTSAPARSLSPGQIGTVQTPPIARPIQSNQIPTAGTIYTAPRSAQPEQNRRAR